MKRFLLKLRGCQKGLTLVELLVALAIGSLLIVGISTIYIQIIKITKDSSNHMTALRQVQVAGHWVSLDTQGAKDFDFSADPWELTIYWDDINGIEYSSVYRISEQGVLTREYYNAGILAGTAMIAESIVPAETVYDLTLAHGVEFRVTAQVHNITETRAYRVLSRLLQ
jgi:prepilin-type N-terminal cleavage/methylation domain-containing protein